MFTTQMLDITIQSMSAEISFGGILVELIDDNLTRIQVIACCHLWPLLLTWLNSNPSMDK